MTTESDAVASAEPTTPPVTEAMAPTPAAEPAQEVYLAGYAAGVIAGEAKGKEGAAFPAVDEIESAYLTSFGQPFLDYMRTPGGVGHAFAVIYEDYLNAFGQYCTLRRGMGAQRIQSQNPVVADPQLAATVPGQQPPQVAHPEPGLQVQQGTQSAHCINNECRWAGQINWGVDIAPTRQCPNCQGLTVMLDQGGAAGQPQGHPGAVPVPMVHPGAPAVGGPVQPSVPYYPAAQPGDPRPISPGAPGYIPPGYRG